MELFKNKLLILGMIAVLLLGYIWLRPNTNVNKDNLIKWISRGYVQQFCSVIYPRIANCVTMTPKECPTVAANEISGCISTSKIDIPGSASQAEAKKLYDSFGICFENRMHDHIRQVYMVNSLECQQKLG